MLVNGKYQLPSVIDIEMSTNGDVATIDVISNEDNKDNKENKEEVINTSNVEKKIDNPKTSSIDLRIVSLVVIITALVIFFIVIRKSSINKYLIFILLFVGMTTIYAVSKFNFKIEANIEIEKLDKLFDTVVGTNDNSCSTKYDGLVTDEVNNTKDADNVYFASCVDKRNVIFGGYCWQVVRTTETKGTRLLYNGEVVDGKCLSTRENHNGLVASNTFPTTTLGGEEYLYGESFTYDVDTKNFTLVDTKKDTWSDSTYEGLLGKYTCKSLENECSTLYFVGDYLSDTKAYSQQYTIKVINHSVLLESDYSFDTDSLGLAGYMYNKMYKTGKRGNVYGLESKVASTFTYNSNTKKYTLSGTIKTITNWGTSHSSIGSTHYTCFSTSTTCDELYYIFRTSTNSSSGSTRADLSYLIVEDGKKVDTMMNEMLYSNDVNKNNSIAKTEVDYWFKNNLLEYASNLEDTVYCNDRNTTDIAGWKPNGGSTTANLKFNNYENKQNLECSRITDQFSTSNDKAKLTYPVALISKEELNLLNNQEMANIGSIYWTMSPYNYSEYVENNRISATGTNSHSSVKTIGGIRPYISLKSGMLIESGSGLEEDPWIIKTSNG